MGEDEIFKPNCYRKTDKEETIWKNFESTRENYKMDIKRKVRKVVDNSHLVQDEVLSRGSC
jgi:hypothetical protein